MGGGSAADRDAALLRALHDEHAAALRRYVVRLTGDEQFAEDIVQETLLRAWKHPEILTHSAPSRRGWLYTVARNLVIDDRRTARAHNEFGTEEVPDQGVTDSTDAVLDSWLVTDALDELSEDHRRVVILCYYGGKTVADMAEQLQIPPGTVKSRLHYGLQALRLALQERGVTRS